MSIKEKIKETVDALPNKFTLDDLFERLIHISKIEEGLKDIEGNTYTTDEVKQPLSID